MVEEEEHHKSALDVLVETADGFTSTHALAETFATLTSGRLRIQLNADEALHIIAVNVIQRLKIIELSLSDYQKAMKLSRRVGARGGAIYDVLHLQAARRIEPDRIFTINLRHLQTLAPDLKDIIRLP
jgi:predicted nucleic acid-binding protein